MNFNHNLIKTNTVCFIDEFKKFSFYERLDIKHIEYYFAKSNQNIIDIYANDNLDYIKIIFENINKS